MIRAGDWTPAFAGVTPGTLLPRRLPIPDEEEVRRAGAACSTGTERTSDRATTSFPRRWDPVLPCPKRTSAEVSPR